MRALTDGVLSRAAAGGTTPRAAAHAVAEERLSDISERFGWYRS
jgi:glutamate dehydrogenase (NAD(P)+)